MADEAKLGRPWQSDELEAIVADYFVMLLPKSKDGLTPIAEALILRPETRRVSF